MFQLVKWKIGLLALLLIVVIFCFIFGIVFNILVSIVMGAELKNKLPLRNGTMAFKFWQMPPVPIAFNIYIFDIVNPDEVLAGTDVPAVIEKGPYVYRMHIEKTDIKWHENNTVEYIQPQTFVFDREASVGPDTDTFTTINIPYITVATLLQYEYSWLQETADAFFRVKKEETFMKRSVYDIWWGYEDPVLEEVAAILHKLNKSSSLFNGKFGFYMDKNNTGDGLYNVFSGLDEKFDNYVEIDRWNGEKNLSLWTTDYANGIRGTDGSMHPPYISSKSNLSIFDAYLHRSLKLRYNGTSSYRGIDTLRFYVPYSEFATAAENPDNAGFCTPDITRCVPSGAYNMSVASYYAPMFVSLPHFVGGDSYYQTQVRGLSPDQSKHQPFYDIHAITGISMRAARRYQIIVRTQSFKHFTKFVNFPVSYLPVLWIDGVADIDHDTATMMKDLIQDPLDALPYIRIGLFILTGVVLLVVISLFIFWRYRNKKNCDTYERLNNEKNEPLNEDSSSKCDLNQTIKKMPSNSKSHEVVSINSPVSHDQAATLSESFGVTFESSAPTIDNRSKKLDLKSSQEEIPRLPILRESPNNYQTFIKV